MHLSLPKWFRLFILASSVCWSLQCLNFRPDTRRAVVVTFFSLTCSVVLWGGRNTANKYHWRVWGATLGLPPLKAFVLSQTTLLRLQVALQGAGPGLHELPRSKPFRFSGTPQRHRLGWACILCPSRVQAAQATRCLASALSQFGGGSYHLPHPSRPVSWVRRQKRHLKCVVCLLWEADF